MKRESKLWGGAKGKGREKTIFAKLVARKSKVFGEPNRRGLFRQAAGKRKTKYGKIRKAGKRGTRHAPEVARTMDEDTTLVARSGGIKTGGDNKRRPKTQNVPFQEPLAENTNGNGARLRNVRRRNKQTSGRKDKALGRGRDLKPDEFQ